MSTPLRATALYGIEAALPFAVVASVWPSHPRLDTAVEFLRQRRDSENAIVDREVTTTEGAYIAAYPLAVIARVKSRRPRRPRARLGSRSPKTAGRLWLNIFR